MNSQFHRKFEFKFDFFRKSAFILRNCLIFKNLLFLNQFVRCLFVARHGRESAQRMEQGQQHEFDRSVERQIAEARKRAELYNQGLQQSREKEVRTLKKLEDERLKWNHEFEKKSLIINELERELETTVDVLQHERSHNTVHSERPQYSNYNNHLNYDPLSSNPILSGTSMSRQPVTLSDQDIENDFRRSLQRNSLIYNSHNHSNNNLYQSTTSTRVDNYQNTNTNSGSADPSANIWNELLNQYKDQLTKLKQENTFLLSEKQTLQMANQELNNSLLSLQETKDQYKIAYQDSEGKLLFRSSQVKELEEDHQNRIQLIQELTLEKDHHERAANSLQKELADLQRSSYQTIDSLENQLKQSQETGTVSSLEEKLDLKTKEVELLSRRLIEMEEKYSQELVEMKQIINSLSLRLKTLSSVSAASSSNTTSVVPPAASYYQNPPHPPSAPSEPIVVSSSSFKKEHQSHSSNAPHPHHHHNRSVSPTRVVIAENNNNNNSNNNNTRRSLSNLMREDSLEEQPLPFSLSPSPSSPMKEKESKSFHFNEITKTTTRSGSSPVRQTTGNPVSPLRLDQFDHSPNNNNPSDGLVSPKAALILNSIENKLKTASAPSPTRKSSSKQQLSTPSTEQQEEQEHEEDKKKKKDPSSSSFRLERTPSGENNREQQQQQQLLFQKNWREADLVPPRLPSYQTNKNHREFEEEEQERQQEEEEEEEEMIASKKVPTMKVSIKRTPSSEGKSSPTRNRVSSSTPSDQRKVVTPLRGNSASRLSHSTPAATAASSSSRVATPSSSRGKTIKQSSSTGKKNNSTTTTQRTTPSTDKRENSAAIHRSVSRERGERNTPMMANTMETTPVMMRNNNNNCSSTPKTRSQQQQQQQDHHRESTPVSGTGKKGTPNTIMTKQQQQQQTPTILNNILSRSFDRDDSVPMYVSPELDIHLRDISGLIKPSPPPPPPAGELKKQKQKTQPDTKKVYSSIFSVYPSLISCILEIDFQYFFDYEETTEEERGNSSRATKNHQESDSQSPSFDH
jgi:hypothetical protein